MRQEIVGHLRDPVAHLLAAEVDGLADDVGVELLALGDDGGKHRGTDRAAEVAHHVGDAGSRGRILRRDAAERDVLSGASVSAWPTARTMLGMKSWSPE